MEAEKVLQGLGLEPKEAKVYLALVDLGETTATRLAEEAGVDRTLVYQLTAKLIERGLATYIVKNNVRHFSASDPDILLKNVQEKEQQLKGVLPDLKARHLRRRQQTTVEIYRGREGVATILKMIVREGQPYCILGGAQEACAIFELQNRQFLAQAERLRLPGKILARRSDSFFIGRNEEYRFVPDSFLSSTTMVVWGEKTGIFVWSEPYYVILIENGEIAKSNLTVFQYLWSGGEKPSAADRRKRLMKR